MAEFTWLPSYSSTNEKEFRTRESSYGDGYVQSVADGINNLKETWAVGFENRTATEIAEIDGFLEARGGYEPFDWVPPGEDQPKKFRCKRWTIKWVEVDVKTLTATFERVYKP